MESAYFSLCWRLDEMILYSLERLWAEAFSFFRSTMPTVWTSDGLARVLGPW